SREGEGRERAAPSKVPPGIRARTRGVGLRHGRAVEVHDLRSRPLTLFASLGGEAAARLLKPGLAMSRNGTPFGRTPETPDGLCRSCRAYQPERAGIPRPGHRARRVGPERPGR